MDALIEPSFFGALPDADKLAAELSGSLAQATSYEDLLDRARQFGQEHMFLIGARILSGTVSAEQAGEAFARLADVLIRAVHRAVEENFVGIYGRMKGQQSIVLSIENIGHTGKSGLRHNCCRHSITSTHTGEVERLLDMLEISFPSPDAGYLLRRVRQRVAHSLFIQLC